MGGSRCNYVGCKNTSALTSMFRFPINSRRLPIWLANCGNSKIAQFTPQKLKNRYLCIDHFDRKYLKNVNGRRKRLLKTAIPFHYQASEIRNKATTPSQPSTSQEPSKWSLNYLSSTPETVLDNLKRCRSCSLNGKQHVTETEESNEERVFSWNHESAVVPCDSDPEDDVQHVEWQTLYDTENDVCRVEGKESGGGDEARHTGYQCNSCGGEIQRFRYACVQCPDYDLCGACEARGMHALHYMLRVPGTRPSAEVQRMLEYVRRSLGNERADTSSDALELSTVQVKDEPEDPFLAAATDVAKHDPLSDDEGTVAREPLSDDEGTVAREPLSDDEGTVAREPLSDDESTVAHEPLSDEEGTVAHEPLSDDEGTVAHEPLSDDEGTVAHEPLSDEEGTVAREPLSDDEGTVAHEPLSDDEGTVAHEPLSDEEGTVAREPLSDEEGTVAREPLSDDEGTVVRKPVFGKQCSVRLTRCDFSALNGPAPQTFNVKNTADATSPDLKDLEEKDYFDLLHRKLPAKRYYGVKRSASSETSTHVKKKPPDADIGH